MARGKRLERDLLGEDLDGEKANLLVSGGFNLPDEVNEKFKSPEV